MADLTRKVVLELLARNRARGELASFSAGIDRTFRSVRRMAGGILALAGIGGIGYLIKREMAAIDATAKLADRLGMGTEKLVAIQHAAKIAGVEQGTLNKSLEMFSQRLGEAKAGTGEAKDTLKNLGLTFEDLINKSPDEALGIVADRIKNLATQAEKANAMNDLFGRSGKQLLNLFEKGSAGLREYEELMRKTGNAFTRIDAAKVEAANDALANTRVIFAGIAKIATIELSPYIEAAATSFNNWAVSGEGVGAMVTRTFENASLGAIQFANQLEAIPARYDEIMAKLMKFNAFIEKTPIGQVAGIGRRIAGAESPAKLFAEYELAAKEAAKKAAANINAVEKFFTNLRQKEAQLRADYKAGVQWPSEGVSDADLWLRRLEASNQKAVDSTDKSATQRLQIIDKMYRDMGSLSDDWYRNQINMLGMQRADYAQHVDDKLLLDRWYYSEITKINDQIRQQELEREQERLQIAGHFLDETRNRFITFWDPVIDKSKDAKQAMDDFFQSLFIRFAQAKAQMAMLNLLNLGTGGGWGGTSILGFGFAKGGIVGRDGEPRMVPAAAFAGAERFDQGGIVGLKSNEVPIIAHRGERIISKEQSASGGQPVIINYYIDAIDATSFQKLLANESDFLAALHNDAYRRNNRNVRMR